MTNKAYEILREMWDNRSENPQTPEEFKDLVFINKCSKIAVEGENK